MALLTFMIHAAAQSDSPLRSVELAAPPAPLQTISVSNRISLLNQRQRLLEERLAALKSGSTDYLAVSLWLEELRQEIENLQFSIGKPSSTSLDSANIERAPATVAAISANEPSQLQPAPQFMLNRPTQGATNEIVQLELAWTEDRQPNKPYTITRFIVELSLDGIRFQNGRFRSAVFIKEVVPSGVRGQEIKVPKDTLRSGQKYYWQVLAEFTPNGTSETQLQAATNAPLTFKTAAQTFDAFERRGLTLQRAVSGDDATEGAQFGFLKTFHQKTVYTADFALIYNNRLSSTQRTNVAFQASVQGDLTSDDSQSEDALQFRAGAIIDRNLKPRTINHLYTSLAVKYETDQKFKIGKLISENMVTPTLRSTGIGIPFGRPSDPIQFRWRPYFYFDVGRSFKRGDSAELKDTVLRFTPRVRTVLSLNFLRRALNLNDTYLFADDWLYFLPLEKTKTRRNMFTSGFVFQMTNNFGFGLTYKSGEAAPKFKPVHTFGGVLTIRFGKEE